MENKAKFFVGIAAIVVGLLFILCVGLLFFADISVADFRLSTQFDSDLKQLTTRQYLMDDFNGYENTQRVRFDGLNDFSKYSSKGIIVGWTDVKNYSQINSIDLELSSSSNYIIKGIDNKPEHPRILNGIWSNDEFVDYSFENQPNSIWEDWMLANGENMVFWEWNDPIPINMNEVLVKTNYPVRDAFIIKGFSKDDTPTQRNWIAPHGLIQYGFHYIENGSLFMKNVRQTQMVTNGDHARIISNTKGTPQDFIMRVQFTPTNIQKNPTKNDYIRIAWDFEDKWDPGHDQTLIYVTDEYQYFGMQRVYPIVRQKEQGYENSPKKPFRFVNDRLYEIDVRVQGQIAKSAVYEKRFGMLWKKASIEYIFKTPRPIESYPFSIEATGNPDLKINFIEVREILD